MAVEGDSRQVSTVGFSIKRSLGGEIVRFRRSSQVPRNFAFSQELF